ncbi:hypothetical protein [Aureibacter tunicatorum]|uniref:adenosine deaminase n=1 Tax=Aureibacter tunicatorum TaxID=866807 RepID=A0AAE3XPU7_9BACT|nr:hypothetical protein [Aureibacter tunicatorum]MDR6240483.1 hypothetical protein [Aureibacter tunicatorum]BDD06654.1 hypothetical protein AUTU_41370 [Aureibacter tunicatorum]
MNNLRSTLSILFKEQSADDLWLKISNNECYSSKIYVQDFSKEDFIRLGSDSMRHYTQDEVRNLFHLYKERYGKVNDEKYSVFFALKNFVDISLKEKDGFPVVAYEHLLRWRETSHDLGEDVFTTAFMASKNLERKKVAQDFSWRPVIGTDNVRLTKMLEQGVAENHFHLYGSAPHFELSWMALMNLVAEHKSHFRDNFDWFFEKSGGRKSELKISSMSDYSSLSLITKVRMASLIRLVLSDTTSDYDLEKLKWIHNAEDFDRRLGKIQQMISERKHSAFDFQNSPGKDAGLKFSKPDYLLRKGESSCSQPQNFMLTGEREFLYDKFTEIFRGCEEKWQDYFYLYLLIKKELRREFIQTNQRIGFQNFADYQDRKKCFLPDGSYYERAMVRMAMSSSFGSQEIKSFETRIAPKDTLVELLKEIEKIDRFATAKYDQKKNGEDKKITLLKQLAEELDIDRELLEKIENHKSDKLTNSFDKDDFFYTLHFIKQSDKLKPCKISQISQCRNFDQRKIVKKQAQALVNLRESSSSVRHRILGIDSANTEIACRPEMFAQAFRFLKKHRPSNQWKNIDPDYKPLPFLRATFHAGEDFFDLVDGLRYIEEAIRFLNLRQGDRLGHALALGVNALDFYRLKRGSIVLPKHDLLDNIAWLLTQQKKYDLKISYRIISELEHYYTSLLREIYRDTFEETIDYQLFYSAWKLRGDDPELYYLITDEFKVRNNITFWESCAMNDCQGGDANKYMYDDLMTLRKDKKVRALYHHYHYNADVKRIGFEMTDFVVPEGYAEVIDALQKAMRYKIEDLQIGIECNPSSNQLIGPFEKYDQHPMLTFYNRGLTNNDYDHPQLFISINTDDQGVFGTYLENEYALMAKAMEKMKDQHGNRKYSPDQIYDYLDRVRKMGIEQSFKKGVKYV